MCFYRNGFAPPKLSLPPLICEHLSLSLDLRCLVVTVVTGYSEFMTGCNCFSIATGPTEVNTLAQIFAHQLFL